MHANFVLLRRTAGLLAGLGLALGTTGALRGAGAKEADAFPTFDSYIKISGQAPDVTGNGAAFAERMRTPENGAYGIEALHLSKDLKNDVSLEIDGKALSGKEDYLGTLKFTKNEFGSFEVGYKRFRTFYDGIGGFFPKSGAWFPLSPEELHTDRGNFHAGFTIAIPDKPVFSVRYTDERRTGKKDSTIWGDSDYSGIPIYNVSSLNPVSANRKIIPSYVTLDERQRTLEGSVRHTLGNTEFELVATSTKNTSDDTRFMRRYPGELKPYPLFRTTAPAFLIDPSQANNFIQGFDNQKSDADIWSLTGKFETKFNDQLSAFGGVTYFDAAADIAGDREMTLSIATGAGVIQALGGFVGSSGRPPYSYKTDYGHTTETNLTANVGLRYKPSKDGLITLAVKREEIEAKGTNQVTYYSTSIVQATGATTAVNAAAPNVAKRSENAWVPELDVRYSGFKNLALYGTVDYRTAPGKDYGSSTGVGTGGILGAAVVSHDNTKLNHGHYKVGANWTVTPILTVRAETYYKDHTNKYVGFDTSAGSSYVLGYSFHGYKVTGILKLLPTLTLTGRYVGQKGEMQTTVDDEEEYRSMDSKNHMFGATIDWNPSKSFYVQGNLNYTLNKMSTAYPQSGLAANDVIRDADNNYTNGSILAGFVVGKKTDAQLEYSFYRADNYEPLAPPSAIAYGAGAKESVITAGLKHVLTDKMILNAKVGYIDSQNDTTGGKTNFHGPVAYLAIDYSL